MNKKFILRLLLGGALVVVLGIAYLLRPTQEVSEAIEAIPLDDVQVDSDSENNTDLEEQPLEGAINTEVPFENNEVIVSEDLMIFQIIQDRSEVRFSLDELLRGNPFRPVGKTNQVAGEIGIDFSNPSKSQLGTILINARGFQTDSSNRDRAIKNQILDTNEFEYIRFDPTSITGFPSEIVVGEEVALEVSGDLTVRNITNPVTFYLTVTLITETEILGYASTVVLRSDFGLKIPSVTSVAEVSDEVLLEIEFFAGRN